MQDFMLTYRSFTRDGLELLEGLKARVACAIEPEETRVSKLRFVCVFAEYWASHRVFHVLKLWFDKFWFDFLKDCPALANKTVEWLETIIADPASGGGAGPEYSGSAKVAAGLRDKLLRKLVTPEKNPVRNQWQAKEWLISVSSITRCWSTREGIHLQWHLWMQTWSYCRTAHSHWVEPLVPN